VDVSCGSVDFSIRLGGAGLRTSFPGVWDRGNQPRSHEPRTGAEWNL